MNTVPNDLCTEAASTLTAEDIAHILFANRETFARLKESALKLAVPVSEVPEVQGDDDGPEEDGENPSRRRSVRHEWPEIGTELQARYFTFDYRATVIQASKRLKSGKQVRIETGPAAGRICDSLSLAMLEATAEQREREGLNRKGVANGWDFWSWEGKSKNSP